MGESSPDTDIGLLVSSLEACTTVVSSTRTDIPPGRGRWTCQLIRVQLDIDVRGRGRIREIVSRDMTPQTSLSLA